MACRGVFFALDADEVKKIRSASDDEQLMEVIEAIEEEWDQEFLAECDKSWDAMHRTLADGTLEWNGGDYPLNQVVLGEPSIHQDSSYVVCFKDNACVNDIAKAIRLIDRSKFEALYFAKAKDYALEYGEEDCEYTWENFQDVRRLYGKASETGRAVIFTVDQ